MSRNGSGVYSLPAGSTAVTGDVASASVHNTPLSDLEADMNVARPIVAGGTGATSRTAARQGLYVDNNYTTTAVDYTPIATDRSKVIRGTAALTLNLTAAATLADGWFIDVIADGGIVTIDPNGSELIDGATTITIADGKQARVMCTGSAFYSMFQSPASDLVNDTTPQLGGNLDGQGNDLTKLGTVSLTEQAAANTDVAGDGQLWVKTATPNELWFTDDAGTDFKLNTTSGGYTADISLLYLGVAENKGDRLNMVGGIMDPFVDSSDVGTSDQVSLSSGAYVLSLSAKLPENMISNTLPSPYVVSEQTPSTSTYKMFDGTSLYFTHKNGEWLKVDYGIAVDAVGYNIRYGLGIFGPITWTFEGSNDDSTWTVLDTQTNLTTGWVLNVDRNFPITTVNYRYYRLVPTASQSGAGAVSYIAGFSISRPPGVYPATLISNSFTASAVPTTARLGVQAQGSLTINTDLIGYVSRDGGTTWTTATLVLIDTLADGSSYYEDAAVNISGQPSGTAMQYKIVTSNAAWTSTDGVLLQWS